MDLLSKKCVPCEVGMPPMTMEEAKKYLDQVKGWGIVENDGKLKISKKFKFNTYMEGIEFVGKIAKVAEEQDHHPDLEVGWRKVTVNFMTHNIGGLSENDFIMAAKINQLNPS